MVHIVGIRLSKDLPPVNPAKQLIIWQPQLRSTLRHLWGDDEVQTRNCRRGRSHKLYFPMMPWPDSVMIP
jgi:hypothetical protein